MRISSIVWTIAVIYGIYCVARFFQTYYTARKTGFPICVIPVNFHSSIWRLVSVPLRPVFQKYLPEDLSFRLEAATYGCEFLLRDRMVQRYGSTVVLCGIGSLQVFCADPTIINQVLSQPKRYPTAPVSQKFMTMCGPNVLSATGDAWRRQRSIVASVINEKISSATWNESITQAEMMLDTYTKTGSKGTTSSVLGLKQISFNVLGAVGYGKPREWVDPSLPAIETPENDFLDVLRDLADNLVIAALIPVKVLLSPVMPAFVRKVGNALIAFPKHADALVIEERRSRSTSNNLMSTIVKLIDEAKGDSKVYLSKEEISGNLFIFSLAGYDTTANTMGFALVLLAIYPEWQTWLQEEIDQVAQGNHEYFSSYSQLKRTLAFMFETLRVYTPALHAIRQNAFPETLISAEGKSYPIPINTELMLSFTVLHSSPIYWGQDALDFKPDRWIKADGSLVEPAKGTFIPWSSGPRNCPGMKMSQVEFVSTFYTILRHCDIKPAVQERQTLKQARGRLNGIIRDSLPLITLQMQRPEEVRLKWTRRT